MTVSASYAPLVSAGNDATTEFSPSWPFFSSAEIKVTLISSAGVETVKSLTTHYTVSGGTDSNGLPATGTITMLTAPATGETLVIERVTTNTQATSYANNDAFGAKTHEAAYDRRTLVEQEAKEIAGRSLQANPKLTLTGRNFKVAGSAVLIKWDDATGFYTYEAAPGEGDMLQSTYDPAVIEEQIVGLTATQTLTNKTLTTPTLTLKQSAAPAPTAEGDIQWDTDDNTIKIGDGASTKTFSDDSVNAATYQPLDAGLTDIAALAVTDGNIIVGDGANWVAESGATARTSLGLAIGTNVQAYDAGLTDIAGLAVTDGNIIVGDGANWVAESGGTARTSLGLGTGDSPQFTGIELGHASDTTLTRSAAGEMAIEGVVVKKVGRETIWLPAAAMTARTTNGAASGTTELATNDVMLSTFDFDQTTEEGVGFFIAMPKSWNESTVTFVPYWTAASGSGGVVWGLAAYAFSNDDALDTAVSGQQTSTDTFILANDCHLGPESSAITIGGTPATNDLVYFEITREVANGSDTLTADAKLIGIHLYITTDASTDT